MIYPIILYKRVQKLNSFPSPIHIFNHTLPKNIPSILYNNHLSFLNNKLNHLLHFLYFKDFRATFIHNDPHSFRYITCNIEYLQLKYIKIRQNNFIYSLITSLHNNKRSI